MDATTPLASPQASPTPGSERLSMPGVPAELRLAGGGFRGHWASIKTTFRYICEDFRAVTVHDPALQHPLEVLFLYNGFWAVVFYRLLHVMWIHGFHLLSRFLGMFVKFLTGVEIHPAAQLGPGIFIDHGTGVVIGQTTITGPGCIIYQGVTLGGTGAAKGKRHPTLGRRVVVGAGASVLGPVSLGDFVKVGAGSVVTRNVPADCTVVGIPGRYVRRKHEFGDAVADDLDHGSLADPNSTAFKALYARELLLESMLKELAKELGSARSGRVKLTGEMFSTSHAFRTDIANKVGLRVEDDSEMDSVTQEILRSYLDSDHVDVLVDGAGI